MRPVLPYPPRRGRGDTNMSEVWIGYNLVIMTPPALAGEVKKGA